nr:MAG TPA: hypothetical protein [Crassvirales sp.]
MPGIFDLNYSDYKGKYFLPPKKTSCKLHYVI